MHALPTTPSLGSLLGTRLTATLVLVLSAPALAAQSRVDPGHFSDLGYRHVGPVGNRVSAVAGVPGDPNTYYLGGGSGGV